MTEVSYDLIQDLVVLLNHNDVQHLVILLNLNHDVQDLVVLLPAKVLNRDLVINIDLAIDLLAQEEDRQQEVIL